MKKSLSTLLALSLGLCAHAQITFQKHIRVGIKAGVNASVFSKDVEPFDPRIPGYYDTFQNWARFSGHGGVTFDYHVTDRLSIGAELLYSGRGMSYREENDEAIIYTEDGEQQAYNYFNYKIDYMELPVTVQYNVLSPATNVRLGIYGGFARGVALHKRTKLIFPEADGYDKPENEQNELMYVRNFSTSVIGGLKVSGKSLKTNPFADIRASQMINPVFNRKSAPNGGNLDTRMFTLSLAVGVQF
ncbi:porin family protein [Pedobacter faecalis]|uniref:porin family protein n=1 Tax=Pedobacter faecalis TaxID=3041495 RepID=UPI00254CA977|nr:porin family protein [Pedobacter sp. ELA7]